MPLKYHSSVAVLPAGCAPFCWITLPHAFGEQSGSLVTDTEAPRVHAGAVQDKTIRKRSFLDMVGPSGLSLLLLVSFLLEYFVHPDRLPRVRRRCGA
jgi:hypothetical protein